MFRGEVKQQGCWWESMLHVELNLLWETHHMNFAFSIISQHWGNADRWNTSWKKAHVYSAHLLPLALMLHKAPRHTQPLKNQLSRNVAVPATEVLSNIWHTSVVSNVTAFLYHTTWHARVSIFTWLILHVILFRVFFEPNNCSAKFYTHNDTSHLVTNLFSITYQ